MRAVSKMKPLIGRLRAVCAQWWLRFSRHLDERAKKDKEGWGSRMEYKRRYTNPDEAKRNRKPLSPPSGTD